MRIIFIKKNIIIGFVILSSIFSCTQKSSENGIDRIKSLGFSHDFFVDTRNGWLQLKNRDGRCVFHNGIKCLIYEDRPEGCQLYPITFDNDNNCAILDD